jgi:hypothetical integral membrane protein (TIGR02206 family)
VPDLFAVVTPGPYAATVCLVAVAIAGLCFGARRHPGAWAFVAARVLGALLLVDAVSWIIGLALGSSFSPRTDLPLALCNMAILVAASACWWRITLLVELTYFWGIAGTLQAVITPDLNVGFPHAVFFQYLGGHLGIVGAACFLVIGLRLTPRRGAVLRTFAITVAYSAFVGIVDYAAGANYMFLRRPPSNWTLLKILGPWPWYILSTAGVALVVFTLLYLPFARRDPKRAFSQALSPTQRPD